MLAIFCHMDLSAWICITITLGTLAVLSGREGLDPRVHACWRPYLGWRWWRCPLLDLLCNSRICRVKTHAPRLIHLMRTQKCCRCASVDCRVSLIHYNKLKFGYKILRCPCVYKTICHIEKNQKTTTYFLSFWIWTIKSIRATTNDFLICVGFAHRY